MNIRDISILRRNVKNSNLYDLTKVTFKYVNEEIIAATYKVPKHQEMRIDLICDSLYGNTDYIDFLLNFNNISNPLNIKEGLLLRYLSESDIPPFYVNQEKPENIQNKISSAGRATQTDPARQEFNERNLALPPNIMSKPTQQVVVEGRNVKTNGLFKR